jgi:hypothetical protein
MSANRRKRANSRRSARLTGPDGRPRRRQNGLIGARLRVNKLPIYSLPARDGLLRAWWSLGGAWAVVVLVSREPLGPGCAAWLVRRTHRAVCSRITAHKGRVIPKFGATLPPGPGTAARLIHGRLPSQAVSGQQMVGAVMHVMNRFLARARVAAAAGVALRAKAREACADGGVPPCS